MAEIDDLLSGSLKRLAQPGDATGVADAIRSRVDAGDTGAPANSSGFTSGAGSWLPWVGLIVVAGLVGGAGGAFGLAGRPVEAHPIGMSTGAIGAQADGLQCVGGPVAASLPAGQRVLAIARSADSGWLGLRNPVTLADTVWVSAAQVTVDAGEPAIDTLPVGGACPTASVVIDPPVVVVPVVPSQPSGPTADTTAPSIGSGNASPSTIHQSGFSPDHSTVSVDATDDVGVVSVTASWGAYGPNAAGSANLSPSGSTWSFSFGPGNSAGQTYQVPITITAYDAAGNQSSTVVQVTLQYLLI